MRLKDAVGPSQQDAKLERGLGAGYLDLVKGSSSESQAGTAGLLAAAGAGERLGRGPKAFLRLAGATLLERSVTALTEVVDEVIVAVPKAELERGQQLLPGARFVAGGATRQETVFLLLQATSAHLVLVHDVARPFLERAVGDRVLAAARALGAASAARPVADTLIEATSGANVARDELRSVQTPQGFRRELLLEAHRAALDSGRVATDDAGLVRAIGAQVELVAGSPWLFKLTTPEDLAFAESLARSWDDE
ncbi:MAG: 2-C-methyl-D-erythritol 4-phosphate cytidylyltransferase [Trueperaceae bacterium]